MYVCMCVAEREREGGMIGERKGEEGLEVGGNTLTPLKTFSSHFFFFPLACYFSLYDSDNDDIREKRRGRRKERRG